MKNSLFKILGLTILPIFLLAQENTAFLCSDGIDNDADGYIDCFDSECSGNASCDDFINIPDPSCQFSPTPQPFEIQEVWRTSTTMDARQTPVIGDIDGDGTPEVVGKHHNTLNAIFIFDGLTGALEVTINPIVATSIVTKTMARSSGSQTPESVTRRTTATCHPPLPILTMTVCQKC